MINVVIYGAGEAGQKLKSSLDQKKFNFLFFVDDFKASDNILSHLQLREIKKQVVIDIIFIAIPSAGYQEIKKIYAFCAEFCNCILSPPSLAEVSHGSINEVDFYKALDMGTPFLDCVLSAEKYLNKLILVTGGAGSIGSELTKQLLSSGATVVVLDNSEYNLYNLLESDIVRNFQGNIRPVLGSCSDLNLVNAIFLKYDFDYVFHAAAYKHVPICEDSWYTCLKENVLGFNNILEISSRSKNLMLVLVSSDKAVNPTNIMGASKRLCEILLQSSSFSEKCFVRFGNVIGSSGSVIPKFIRQIEKGGPVTVTHPEMTRYFMSIPQAVNLILHAGMLKTSEFYVLDMGVQVKIVDIVNKLISYHKNSYSTNRFDEHDIEIEYIGLRPGEKLYEELNLGDSLVKTSVKGLLTANEPMGVNVELIYDFLAEIPSMNPFHDLNSVKSKLALLVPGYVSRS